jgi:nucleoside-diphosphate-sugar epimerase
MNSVLETLEAVLGRPVDREYRPSQSGDARDTTADIRRARDELGYAPAASFEDGLAAQLEWQNAELSEFGTLVRSAAPPGG